MQFQKFYTFKNGRSLKEYYQNGPYYKPSRTPLGSFLLGPGILPTPPYLSEWIDMLDKMTMEEQRLYLDENASAMGLLRHN